VVNTAFTVNKPHPSTTAADQLVPNQTFDTIGDRLSAAKLSWAWYSGGWNDALAGNPDSKFQFHHQPFAYFANYADGTAAKAEHLLDETEFIAAAQAGTLPAVSFVKPIGANNEHPGYADVITGENYTLGLIDEVRNGPNWKDTAIIVTYDENGGFWDHVAPPATDAWGPGTRVPALVISPFAKQGFVDHTSYDTTSVLSLIEHRWGLDPLGPRDGAAADMSNAFQP
jgi:acid phosphatase